MTALRTTVLATAALLGASSAFAMPSFAAGENTIEFQTIENQYRSVAACAAIGGCLPSPVAPSKQVDPAGYQKVDPSIANNFLPDDVAVGLGLRGDIFAGVLYVTNILPNFAPIGGEFTGYFAQRVKSVDASIPTSAKITLDTVGAADDPFQILAAGEMFKLYTDPTVDFNPSANITAAASVLAATTGGGGTAWASLGLGAEGYAYTIDNVTVSGTGNFVAKTFYALDLVTKGASYNLGDLNKVNDDSEDPVGGIAGGGIGTLCSPADLVNPAIACTDFAGNADVRKNNQGGASSPTNPLNPWFFRANDPLVLNQVPEPGSLALVGLALAGLGMLRRRAK